MSQKRAEQVFQIKSKALRESGFPLGVAESGVQSAGSGGFVQVFERAHLYWHPNTGAHEVHDRILEAYLHLGGPGAHPSTGRREFGFPKADEARGKLGAVMSQFEFGAIYYVRGHRAVGVFGSLAAHLDLDQDGLPVAEPFRLPFGEVLYCQESCLFSANGFEGQPLRASVRAPQLGKPAMISPTTSRLPIDITMQIPLQLWNELLARVSPGEGEAGLLANLEALWHDRLVLHAVRNKSFSIPVVVQVRRGEIVETPFPHLTITWECRIKEGVVVPDRTLFDIVLWTPDKGSFPLASHAIYTAKDWDTFGFIHATDLHVSRRVEGFRTILKKAGRDDSADLMVNPNDSVRALCNYANKLHAQGVIDFILATGDLVDYVFEEDDDHNGGGNFAYLERLLLGQAPSRDEEGVEYQELHVPIFTVLGNHDFVVNPYMLYFDIDLPWMSDKTLRKWYGFNLIRADAEALQEALEGKKMPTVSGDAAARMAKSDRAVTAYYHRRINRRSSYVVELGDMHRIIMVETGPNADIHDGIRDAFQTKFGGLNEEEHNFLRGTPRSSSRDFPHVSKALAAPPPRGILIVGMHDPPLNTERNEYPHFFRETERPKLDPTRLRQFVQGYLARSGRAPRVPGPTEYKTWPRTGTAHFKEGSIGDFLDFGVVKWTDTEMMPFLQLCIDRRVDAVLCGHIHQRVEMRLRRQDGGDGLPYFTDFYTENPKRYRESFDWSYRALNMGAAIVEGDERPIHIQVDPEAAVGEGSRLVRDHLPGGGTITYRSRRVPPYADPLSDAQDAVAWWSRHRPLILQTACVGPIDYSQRGQRPASGETVERAQVSFQGVRLLTVRGNAISRIRYVSMKQIRSGTILDPPPAIPTGPQATPGPSDEETLA